MRDSKRDIILVIILMSILGLIFTYPLILYFNTGIPYAPFSGGDIPLLRTGDHLQVYYWFWLLKDNLFGGSALFSNPYEFNMIAKQVYQGYHMFPFSLLFLVFTPFGNIFAYNATIILSFILAGTFMYLLTKFYTGNRVAAFFSALIFTLAPFRLSQIFSGHLNGFIFFFFPLIIYLLEVSIKKARLIYAVFAGLSIFSLSLMEPHFIYYLFILLGAYIPLRMLLYCSQSKEVTGEVQHLIPSSKPRFKEFTLIIGIGILFAIFYQIAILRQHDYTFSIEHLLFALFIYPLFCLFVWLFFSAILSFFTPLRLSQALKVDAISYTPVLLLLTYPIQFKFNIPHPGTVLLFLSLGGVCALKIYLFLKFRRNGNHSFNIKKLKDVIITLLPVLLFMTLSVFYLLYKKHSIFDASIVQGGRDLDMVRSFSPHLSDIFIMTNTLAENYIYLGIIPVGLTLFVLICLLSRPDDSFGNQKEDKVLPSFFMLVMLVSYILAIGPSLTNSIPLYKLLYTYLPFFNFPRATGRMVIVTFLAISILAGYGLKELQRRFEDLNKQRLFMVVIILSAFGIAADYYTFRPIGITTLGHGNRIYRYVKEDIGDKILLELPLWPGDSHQSSLYEYYTTLDQVKRVNGYSPAISKEYIDTVFWPLYSLNLGEIGKGQYKLLKEMDVKYITVHENEEMWAHKASPYPPLYVIRRLTASPYLKFIDSNLGISLFEVIDGMPSVQEVKENRSIYRPISDVFPPNLLRRRTGELVGNLLWGSVERDRADFLTFGPYLRYLPGGYLAYFRLKVEDNLSDEYVARIEVSSRLPKGEIILARKELKGRDFLKPGDFQDFYLFFDLDEMSLLEFRTYFYKKVDVWFDRVVITSRENEFPPPYFEAEELPGDVGLVREDRTASNGRCVFGDTELHPPGYLIYGPNQRYPHGRYRALFKIKADLPETRGSGGGDKDIADVDVVSNLGEKILASYTINLYNIKEGGYNLIPLDFQINRPDELGFRVRFRGTMNLCVDKVEVLNIN